MGRQWYNWTCSICAFTWVAQSTKAKWVGVAEKDARQEAADIIGYPRCVNETYGLMNADCMVDAFRDIGLRSEQAWVTYAEAFSIMSMYTGVINPVGMYHYMAIRGTSGNDLWVANSAPGYEDVWDTMSKQQFLAKGPVQLVYVTEWY